MSCLVLRRPVAPGARVELRVRDGPSVRSFPERAPEPICKRDTHAAMFEIILPFHMEGTTDAIVHSRCDSAMSDRARKILLSLLSNSSGNFVSLHHSTAPSDIAPAKISSRSSFVDCSKEPDLGV